MGLDIRWPIGLMFTLIGVLLTGYGAVKGALRRPRFGYNIKPHLGHCAPRVCVLMLLGAVRGGKKPAVHLNW